MKINEIERCLVDPLRIYSLLWGLSLPLETLRVINAQYGPFMALYDALCNYPEFDSDIEKFILKHFDVEDELFPSDVLDDPFEGHIRLMTNFLAFVNKYKELIFELQTKIVLKRLDNPDLQFVKEDMPRFFLNLGYNPRGMALEVIRAMENLTFITPMSEKTTTQCCKFIRESELHVIDVLYNPEYYMDLMKNRAENTVFVTEERTGRTTMKFKKPSIMFNVKKRDNVSPYVSDDMLPHRYVPDEDDIRMSVNKLDEMHGVHADKHMDIIDTRDEFEEQVQIYKFMINKLISALNNINGDKYAKYEGIFGIYVGKMKINKKFRKISSIFDDNSYPITNIKFKSRFVSYVGTWLSRNLEDIATKCYKLNRDSMYSEYEMKMEYVDTAILHFLSFVENILMDKPYGHDIMYLNEIITYMESNSSKKHLKKMLKKITNIEKQTMILSEKVSHFIKHQQDISMDTLLKLSYLVATNETDSTNIVEFQDGYRFNRGNLTRNMIEELGYMVMKTCKKNSSSRMFKFFMKSNPTIRTDYTGLSKPLAVGISAIYYYSFMSNDKYITKIVNKMI